MLDNNEKATALMQAVELQNKAAEIGFDWPDIYPVLEKLKEEVEEFQIELENNAAREKIIEELGDILFVCANLARHLKVSPEEVLLSANRKFARRCQLMQQEIAELYPSISRLDLITLSQLWNKIKNKCS